MLINLGKNGLTIIHRYVVEKLVAVDGVVYKGMIGGSIDRASTTIEGREIFPDVQSKAGSILFAIARFHPFADGCKRTALLSAYLLLLYNGYTLNIPDDSAVFLEKIADLESPNSPKQEDVINWIKKHSKKSVQSAIFNFLLSFAVRRGLNIEEYTEMILERELIPPELRERLKDKELEAALKNR